MLNIPRVSTNFKRARKQKTAAMDAVRQLQKQVVDYTDSLFHEGILDDQFAQLQKLQDEQNPTFVVEVVSLFFEDSDKLINNMRRALEQNPVDYKLIDAHVHQLKGSSSSIGAPKVKSICLPFRSCCEAQNLQGCKICLQQIEYEYSHFKNYMQNLFKMEQKILEAGGSVPIRE